MEKIYIKKVLKWALLGLETTVVGDDDTYWIDKIDDFDEQYKSPM